MTESSDIRGERLKDDPRAHQLIDQFNATGDRREKYLLGLRLAEHLIASSHNDQAQQALDIVREYAKTGEEEAAYMRRQAELLYRQSKYDEAAQLLEQAIVKLGTQPDTMELFHIYRQQAWVYFRQGYLERARSFAEGAQVLLQTRAEGDSTEADQSWAQLYHVLALIDGATGNHDGSLRYYDQEIEILERLGDQDRLGSVYNNISGLLKIKGNIPRALDFQLRSYQISRDTGDLLAQAISCNNLGEIYFGMGDTSRSLEFYQQYREINKKISNRMGDAFGLAGLGRIAHSQNDFAKAEASFLEAAAVAREVGSKNKEASIWSELCDLYCTWGKFDQASQALDKAIALCLETQVFNSQHHQLLNARIKIGQAGLAQGSEQEKLYRQAQTTIEEAMARPITVEDEEPLSEQDLERQAYAMLAEVHHRQQRKDKARQAIDKAVGIVDSMTAYFPKDMKQLFYAKPEIKALQTLKDSIAGGP